MLTPKIDTEAVHRMANWNGMALSESEAEELVDELNFRLDTVKARRVVMEALAKVKTKKQMLAVFKMKEFQALARKMEIHQSEIYSGRQLYDYEQFAYEAKPHLFVITDGE